MHAPRTAVLASLTLATLACATLGSPSPAPYDDATVEPLTAIVVQTEPALPTSSPPTETVAPEIAPSVTPEVEGGASVERSWEARSSSNAYTVPVTHTVELNVPVLRASDPADAPTAAFNAVVQAAVDEMTTSFVSDLEQYPPDPAFGGDGSSFFQIGATPFALTVRVVSLRLDVAGYVAGAAHPYSFSRTVNFDFASSREIELVDLFIPGADFLDPIAAYCTTELSKTEFFAGFEGGATASAMNYRSWNLTPDGLLISFDPYQVGPYAAGPQQITVPYAEVADLIDPAGPAGALAP